MDRYDHARGALSLAWTCSLGVCGGFCVVLGAWHQPSDRLGRPSLGVLALAVGVLTVIILQRHQAYQQYAAEVVEELRQCVFPDRDETRSDSIVVIIFSVIIGGVLWVFDYASGAFTSFLYDLLWEGIVSTEAETDNEGLKWYVVNTYSGYEQQARKQLIKQAASKGFESGFGAPIDEAILVPTEDVEQMVSGKPRVTKRKFFPGYMLVQMRWSPAVATFVRGLPKVIGFVSKRATRTRAGSRAFAS